jgi:hypothetical protein
MCSEDVVVNTSPCHTSGMQRNRSIARRQRDVVFGIKSSGSRPAKSVVLDSEAVLMAHT